MMKVRNLLPLLAILGFACWTPQAAKAQRLHVLLVGQTGVVNEDGMDNHLQFACRKNIADMQRVFRQNLPRHQFSISTLVGANISAARIRSKLEDDWGVTPLDAFVFYYTGAADSDGDGLRPGWGGDGLSREAVREMILAHGPRLAVVITDYLQPDQFTEDVEARKGLFDTGLSELNRGADAWRFVTRITPLFRRLFVRSSGVVDISSAPVTQAGRSSEHSLENLGGLFTQSLASNIKYCQDLPLPWPGLIDRVNSRPPDEVWQLAYSHNVLDPAEATEPAPVLGIHVATEEWQGGVIVTKVLENSPVASVIETGDEIMAVNGQRVCYADRLFHLVHTSATPTMRLTVLKLTGELVEIQQVPGQASGVTTVCCSDPVCAPDVAIARDPSYYGYQDRCRYACCNTWTYMNTSWRHAVPYDDIMAKSRKANLLRRIDWMKRMAEKFAPDGRPI